MTKTMQKKAMVVAKKHVPYLLNPYKNNVSW